MKSPRILTFTLIMLLSCICACDTVKGDMNVVNLRCEYLENPQGIDVARPRLSWMLEADGRGVKQTAYRVLVASMEEKLAKNEGDLWDSGKVESDKSNHVVYDGRKLKSRDVCFWKVKTWTNMRSESDWSEVANWSMGLLKPDDWTADWISSKGRFDPRRVDLKNARWIWHSSKQPGQLENRCILSKHFDLDADNAIKSALTTVSADDSFVLKVNGEQVAKGKEWKSPVTVDIADALCGGENIIEIYAKNSQDRAGAIGKMKIVTDKGKPIEIATDKSWVSSVDSDNAPASRHAVQVLGKYGCRPWGKIGMASGKRRNLDSRNSPMLRKVFEISKTVKKAQISICGLGYYELYLNGSKVGDHVLDPALTPYHKRALYVTYDLAAALRQGENAIGVQLANGIYNQNRGHAWKFQKAPWRAFPQMILQLDVVYADGSKERVVSDESWSASVGPIYRDFLRLGVWYDARREHPGWSTPAFDDSEWSAAVLREGVEGRLSAQMSEPIKVMKTLSPVDIRKSEGQYVVDYGQNIAGWTRLKVSGEAGNEIVLDHSRHGLPQTDKYTLKGEGVEVWEPRFVYHGFDTVKVSGFPGEPEKENFEACVVHTAFEERGSFESSNPLLNKIVEMTRWSYIGNFVGIPTDCPHREKNGWSGDAQVSCEIGMMYYGPEAAYTRWMRDFAALQAEDGKLPCIVPDGGDHWGMRFLDGPAWESAYLIIPWHIFEYRGDRRILENHYQNWKHWLSWYQDQDKVVRKPRIRGTDMSESRYKNPQPVNQDQIITYGIGDWPPIWPTPFEITSTAYYYNAARIIAKTAAMLGKPDEAREYADLAGEIRDAFNREFYNAEDGTYLSETPTAMSCALYFGLVEDANRQRVADNLAESLRKNNYKPTVGCLGAKFLLRALADNGHADTAYRVLTHEKRLGWGSLAASGRTTLTERINGGGSDNHVFLGDVAAWMLEYIAGIRPDPEHPGFQRFIIKPVVIGDLEWARGSHDSPYGRIESSWKLRGDRLSLDIAVPPNSVAEVHLPAASADDVLESGKPAEKARGLRFLRMQKDHAVFEAESGNYKFEIKRSG